MPYLPTNYYPKNTNMEIDNNDNKISFYCLIDNNDIITHAVIRVYDYLKKELKLVIYADEFGKEIQNIEMSDETFLTWKNRAAKGANTSIWTDNENKLPIQGGLTDKSILYIEVNNNNFIKVPQKYFWTIEVFDGKNNVFIVDGNLDQGYTYEYSAKNPMNIKIYPNENIKAGQQIELNYNKYNITKINNNYFDFTTTGKCTKNADGYYIITLNSSTAIPNDYTDLLIQVDVYTFSSVSNSGFDGTYSVNGSTITITTSVQLQETNNIYVYIYRQYQTITIDNKNNVSFPIDTYYVIYGDSIISSQNYFGTQDIQTLGLYTLNESSNEVTQFTLLQDSLNNLNNMYHNFYNIDDKRDIKWYQYIIKQDTNILYESEKIYKSYINFSYNEFFDGAYTLQLKIQYKSDLLKTFNYPLNITNNIHNDIVIQPFLDKEKRAIGINYNNYVSSFTPIGSLIDNNSYNFNILDGVIYNSLNSLYIKPKVKLTYNINEVQFNAFEIRGRLNSIFSGGIVSFGDSCLSYDGYNNELYWTKEKIDSFKPFISSSLLTGTSNQMTDQPSKPSEEYIPVTLYETPKTEDGENITGLYDYDYMSKFDFVIRLDKDKKFIFEIEDGNNTQITINNGFTTTNIANFVLYGDIYWKKINFYNNGLSVFNLNFETSVLNLNAGTLSSPVGYNDYSWLVFRNDYDKNNNIIYKKFIGEILLSQVNNSGIYDYGIGGDNTYDYILVPVYKNNDGNFSSGTLIKSEKISTNWYEVSLFDTNFDNSDLKNSIFELGLDEKWYFELDADSGSITYNTETGKHSVGQKFPKISKSQVNYLSGSLTCKLGRIKDECIYINDNLEYLQKFINFANNNNIKILRLKNGMTIPVDITLKSSKTNEFLVETPTDISFEWTQVGDHLKASLYELF